MFNTVKDQFKHDFVFTIHTSLSVSARFEDFMGLSVMAKAGISVLIQSGNRLDKSGTMKHLSCQLDIQRYVITNFHNVQKKGITLCKYNYGVHCNQWKGE